MAVLGWTLLPLALLHLLWLVRRRRDLLKFQLLLDLVLAAVVAPALVVGGDLNPVRCLDRNRPFRGWQWDGVTEMQPTQSDVVLQFHPWWEESRRQLLEGRLPVVSERIGAGLPLLANGQTGLLSPVMAPVWVLGAERGTTVMAFWKIELAGLGLFLLLRRRWRLRWPGAALGGVAYGGGCYQVAWLLVPLSWVAVGLPWAWWLGSLLLRRRMRWWAVGGVGAGLGWLLGAGLHPETAAVVVGSTLLMMVVIRPRAWRRAAVAALVATVVAVTLSAPTLAYMATSSKVRLATEAHPNRASLPLEVRADALRQLLLPTGNGHPGRGDWIAAYPHAAGATGVGSVVLAAVALAGVRRRHRPLAGAALASLAVAVVLAYRVPPLDWLLVRLPPLDRMTLPRFAVLVGFSLALLAALAVEGLAAGRGRRRPWIAVLGAVLVAAALTAPLPHLAPADAALVVLSVMLVPATVVLARRPALLAVVAAAELSAYAVDVNPVAAPEDRLPRPPMVRALTSLAPGPEERVMGVDGVLPPNLASRYGLRDLRAYDPLRPVPFVRLLEALGEPGDVLGGALRRAPSRLCGVWSVRYLLTPPGADAVGWRAVWSGPQGVVWSNPHWLPPVRAVGRVVRASEQEAVDLLVADELDLAVVAVVPPGAPKVAADRVVLESSRLAAGRVTATVTSDGPCLLVVAVPWAPGWRGRVDGEEVPLRLADLAAMALPLPAGTHEATLTYHPWRLSAVPPVWGAGG